MAEHRPVGVLSPESLAAIRDVFFHECEEHIAEIEAGLTALECGDRDPELINAIFRAVHSVKGGAGIFELDALVQFAHRFESALAEVRAERLEASPDTVRVFLRAADTLADLVQAARDGQAVSPDRTGAISQELERLAVAEAAAFETFDDLDFEPRPIAFKPLPPVVGPRSWRVSFRPHASLYAKGNEPLVLIRELGRLGEMVVELDAEGVPTLDAFDAEDSYLSWTITLITTADEAEILEVFEFVEGDCELAVTPHAEAAPPRPTPQAAASPAAALTEPVEARSVGPPPAARDPTAIRVDLPRVERLVDLVGELVVHQAILAERISAAAPRRNDSVSQALDDLSQLTRDIQESVMAIRAQPVKAVFQRMARLVREAEAASGKRVRLVVEGEATEVDRTVIERLTEPLTHMVRNAVAHGLETPERRSSLGKPVEGLVRISAAQRGGRIVIEVADDGQGLDRERVRALAAVRGLVAEDATLADEDVDNLIFSPGFSTADSISDLSGRGVGLDVVRRGVQALGGRISVSSLKGAGSTFTLSLPLTLAVLDGMLVSVGGHGLIAPLASLIETVQPRQADIRRLGASTTLLSIRGSHVPLVDLGRALGYAGAREAAATHGVALLVEDDTGEQAALLVDEVLGQRQVVIKSLEANYRPVEGIAAATILGDGRVALILDIAAVIAGERRRADHANVAA
jgi:two-component system, chemotaxis family, sensor kinase CheA